MPRQQALGSKMTFRSAAALRLPPTYVKRAPTRRCRLRRAASCGWADLSKGQGARTWEPRVSRAGASLLAVMEASSTTRRPFTLRDEYAHVCTAQPAVKPV